jgi:hypothetical protein
MDANACLPIPIDRSAFNSATQLPFGLKPNHIRAAMEEFVDFLGFINAQLLTRKIERLEALLMPANFSSIVGEFVGAAIPKHCKTLVRNKYHNGHPDLIPANRFDGDAIHHASEGIEIKGSRYLKSWQGHNAEDCWLMVFCFDANGPRDAGMGIAPKRFRFVKVVGAELTQRDWKFAGRSATSRRTITASVTPQGAAKMEANWIYRASE